MVCHFPGGASNSCWLKLTHLIKSSVGAGSFNTTWPSGPWVEKVFKEALIVSVTVPVLRTRRSVDTIVPGLAFRFIGSGDISIFSPWFDGAVWAVAIDVR